MNRKKLKDQSIKFFMHFDENWDRDNPGQFTNFFFVLAGKEFDQITEFVDPIYEQLEETKEQILKTC